MLSYLGKSFFRRVFFLSLSLVVFLPGNIHAQLSVDVNQGSIAPLPISIPDFIARDEKVIDMAANIAKVITADLQRSGLFAPINKQAFLSWPTNLARCLKSRPYVMQVPTTRKDKSTQDNYATQPENAHIDCYKRRVSVPEPGSSEF